MSKLTILIPTFNRPDFLERTLLFYHAVENDYIILVGDASEGSFLERNKQLCYKYCVEHFSFPKMSIGETIKNLNEKVYTPYVAILPDDDLLLPSGVNKIIEFLDNDKHFVSANGLAAVFILDRSGPYGKISDVGDYKQGGVYSTHAVARFKEYLENIYVALFAVHRIGVWRKMWLHTGQTKDVGINDEITPDCLSVVLGRMAHLPDLFLLRQHHDRRYIGKKGNAWKNDPNFAPSRQMFIDTLGIYMPKQFAQEGFDKYFTNFKQKPEKKKRFNIPFLKKIKMFLLDFERVTTLRKLRNKKRPYYHEFLLFEHILSNEEL